jgi:hypothetical protein
LIGLDVDSILFIRVNTLLDFFNRNEGSLDPSVSFRDTHPMHKRNLPFLVLISLLLSGCSALGGSPTAAALETEISPIGEESAYSAPTLPPVNTATLAPTKTHTPPPTSTPFTIAVVDTATPNVLPATIVPTTDLDYGGWEHFESAVGISFDKPINMNVRDLGRLIRIGDPSFSDEGLQLYIEFHIDPASSGYLPEGINPADPRSIIDGELREFKEEYTEIIMIRSVSNVIMNIYPGADTALFSNSTDVPGTHELTWYLAAVVNGDTIVRMYAHTPVSNPGTYLSLAQHIIRTIDFPTEP